MVNILKIALSMRQSCKACFLFDRCGYETAARSGRSGRRRGRLNMRTDEGCVAFCVRMKQNPTQQLTATVGHHARPCAHMKNHTRIQRRIKKITHMGYTLHKRQCHPAIGTTVLRPFGSLGAARPPGTTSADSDSNEKPR